MEFSEAFRSEDISKTDFFDFVVTPEDMGNDMVLHNNFPAWSRKSLFNNNNTDNHNNNINEQHVNVASNSDGCHPAKEANNNILPNFSDDAFWDTGGTKVSFAAAAASVNIKMEQPTLEDIQDICWAATTPTLNQQASNQRLHDKDAPAGDGNTDGSIYTLTVVNGQEGPQQAPQQAPQQGPQQGAQPGPATPVTGPEAPPPWYRPPDLNSILREGDEQLRQAMSAMESQYQTPLDIDSIISILPSLPSMDGLFSGQSDQGHHHTEDLLATTTTCDDSGFVESKEDLQQQQQQQQQPSSSQTGLQETERRGSYGENNNDWAYSNHNEGDHSSAESLLRSALQGGKTYLNQYGGQHDTKTLTELGAPGQSAPPDHASLGLFMSGDGMLPMDGGGPVLLFDDSGGIYGSGPASSASQCTSTCTSTTCMDDILMSPLDDYEKLKMIENEVAESAKRYGVPHPHQVNGLGHGHGHGPSHYGAVPVPPQGPPQGPPARGATPHSSTPPSRPKKKSSKRSGERPPAKSKSSSSGSSGVSSSGGVGSTPGGSSNGGVRRERSLHHCTICSKAFKDKYSVNVHIRTHTGEKPFACSVCGKSFRQKAHLAKHYHTHIVQKSEHLGPTKALSTKAR